MTTSKKLTIFEGPDGCGKTTAAKKFAEETGSRYVHFGPLPHVKDGLFRMYVEAMLPALLGYQDVVFDRAWPSEEPYGTVFRQGNLRVSRTEINMLERLSMRCGAVVIYCLADHITMVSNFEKRKGDEYLDLVTQLIQVRDIYETQNTALPFLEFDYTNDKPITSDHVDTLRMPLHPLSANSAGNWSAGTVLVGESFAEPKNQDPLYQWPFASLSKTGCSQWITSELDKAGIREDSLLWLNADQLPERGGWMNSPYVKIVAMGAKASSTLSSLSVKHVSCPHPQAHRRFHSGDVYQLINILKGKS